MTDPNVYFAVWSAIIFGMGIGFGLAHLMRLGGWGTAIMVVVLFGMAFATPRFGPMLLVSETTQVSP